MVKFILLIIACAGLKNASSQTIEYLTSSPVPMPSSSSSSCSQWDELLPALKMIKGTSGIKKERLLNVVRIIKFLLSDEIERKQCDKILGDIKETNEYQCPDMPDIDSIVDERLRPIKEALDGKNMDYEKYMANMDFEKNMPKNMDFEKCMSNMDFEKNMPKNMDFEKDTPKNKTADFSRILAKIAAALAKVKENNENAGSVNPSTIAPVFKSKKNGCSSNLNQPLFEALGLGNLPQKQTGMNSISNAGRFEIPCQRAMDILEETSSYVIPKDAYCDLPNNINLNSILKDPKLNSDNLPFKIVPNSVSCVDADDSIAILFKPKKISFMQVYGNLLKKITLTVLVPYHVSKLAL